MEGGGRGAGVGALGRFEAGLVVKLPPSFTRSAGTRYGEGEQAGSGETQRGRGRRRMRRELEGERKRVGEKKEKPERSGP